jgi:DNA (cytosine-5)-methyltransferase 1
VLVENVPALLSRGLGVVLGDLASLGYDAEWHCIPAAAVGAPHIRDRVFIVGHNSRDANGIHGHSICSWNQTDSNAGGTCDGCNGGKTVSDTIGEGLEVQPRQPRDNGEECSAAERDGIGREWWSVEPDVGRVAHGVPARVHRLRCLGNAVVPQVAKWIGERILEAERKYDETNM